MCASMMAFAYFSHHSIFAESQTDSELVSKLICIKENLINADSMAV